MAIIMLKLQFNKIKKTTLLKETVESYTEDNKEPIITDVKAGK
jgi:hypothetical protein